MPRAIDDERAAKVTSERVHYIILVGHHDADVDFRTVSIDRTSDLERWAEKAI